MQLGFKHIDSVLDWMVLWIDLGHEVGLKIYNTMESLILAQDER